MQRSIILINTTISPFRYIRKLVPALILFTLLPGQGFAQEQSEDGPKVLDEIVAKVNDEIITLTDLQESLTRLEMDIEQNVKDPSKRDAAFEDMKESLLGTMITNRIVVQKAEELGISDDIDQDVDMYIENVRQESGAPSLDIIDEYFRQRGSSLAQYRRSIREQMIIRSMISQFVYSKITLLTPEIESYYEEHKDEFTEEGKVKLAEIVLLTEGKDKAAVRERAEEILAQVDSENFADMAREYSEGPTADQGGEIGEFKQSSINKTLREEVFSIEVGSHTGIIEADFGFQIVKVLDRTPTRVKPLQEVRGEISEALYEKKAGPEVEKYTNQLISESYIYVNPDYISEYDLEGLI